MTRPITFSLYNHKKDNKTQIITKSWDDWIPILTTHKVRGAPEDSNSEEALNQAKDGPALILGEVKNTRSANNVKNIHALGLDIDDSTFEQIKDIIEKLSDFEYVLYTTHKHGSQVVTQPRIRVILPLLSPVEPLAYPKTWEALQTLVGGAIDESTKDCSRLHFLPSTFDLSVASTMHNKGRWIALEDLQQFPHIDEIDDLIQEDEHLQLLRKITGSLRGLHKTDSLKPAASALIKGEPFADAPNRHKTILRLTIYLARKFPKLPINTLKQVFSTSLEAMSSQPDPPTMQEVVNAFQGAREKINQPTTHESKIKVYSSHDLKHIASLQNCTVEDLENRWIIQKDGGGWILDQFGNYRGYYPYRDFPIAIRKYLAGAPVELFEITEKGKKRYPTEELLARNGDIAKTIVSDLSAQYTTYNPDTCTLTEAVTPLRPLQARFDPQIDTWLKLLFGSNYEKGLDWMSVCPDLTKQLCAIYFAGVGDSGKTLFALGLAKLWTEGAPADIMLVMGDFNEELVRCPLVLADEELPKKYQKQSVTTKLRSMLSTTTRSLHRKYMPPAELEGAIRLVLTANNDFLLTTDELHTTEDLAAISQRFMYIQATEEPAKYLATLDRDTTGRWLERGIAEHTLWLAENRTIKNPGNRFAVEGDISAMHRRLLVDAPWSSVICEWMVGYLMNPMVVDNAKPGLVIRRDGALYVTTEALMDNWDKHVKDNTFKPDPRKIGTALKTISTDSGPARIRFGESRRRYKCINMTHVYYWMKEYNIGDKKTVEDNLAINTKEPEDNVVDLDRGDRESISEY